MTVATRLAGFAAVLALVLLGGLGLGRAIGPADDGGQAGHDGHGGEQPADGDHSDHGNQRGDQPGAQTDGPGDGHGGGHQDDADAAGAVTGLAVSEDGYTLRPDSTVLAVGTQQLRFRIDDEDGTPVTAFDLTHERELHLVVVRRDGTGFQHLHPERADDGTWATALTLDRAGAYRAYADFAPAGEPARTLAVDLLVPGRFDPQPWPAPRTATTADGYDVRLSGHLVAGEQARLVFDVTRDGRPVDLERYLGAAGHLVVLREGDLGYLHVHADGDELAFATTAPNAGRYRLYLQVQVDGAVRTAELTVEAEEAHA